MPSKSTLTITQSILKHWLTYDPNTGIFTRNKSAGNTKVGDIAGNPCAKGYLKMLLLGQMQKMHRLAWLYVYGSWPEDQIDHINVNKADNRIINLRVCNTSANCLNQVGARKNNALGIQGVHQINKTGRYRAACSVQGVKHQLGVFLTAEEASKAYSKFKSAYLP